MNDKYRFYSRIDKAFETGEKVGKITRSWGVKISFGFIGVIALILFATSGFAMGVVRSWVYKNGR